MLNVPESIKTLYQTDGINKNFRVHFPNGENEDLTNKDIVEGSVKFVESVSSKDVLKFGLSEQSRIEFECVGVQNIFGMTIECFNEIDTSSLTSAQIQEIRGRSWDGKLVLASWSDIGFGYFRIPLGTFRVESCPRSHGAMAHRRVTAYSNTFIEEYEQYRTLCDGQFPYKYIEMDAYVLLYLLGIEGIDSTILTPQDKPESGGLTRGGFYYNASGQETTLGFNLNTPYQITDLGSTTNAYGDFVYIESSIDYEKYEQNGMAIVKAIDDAGLDLRYDSKKNRVFNTNEEAIRTKSPWLFSPVVAYGEAFGKVSGAEVEGYIDDTIKVHNGLNILVVNELWAENHAFVGREISNPKWFYDGKREPQYLVSQGKPASNMFLVFETRLTYQPIDYEYRTRRIEKLKVPSGHLTGAKLKLNSSLTSKGHWFSRWNTSSGANVKDATYKKYIYQNTVSFPELLKGLLELSAQFGRVGRTGNEIKKLSKQNPINIEPSDVEELWWDEYDVEPIGTVRYNLAETQSIVEYQIGNGGSVYDFGDNYFFKRIFASYTEDNYTDAINLINSLIDQYFVPNVTDVPFVPVDMTMRGLPYVESGDYIVYDDGIDQVGTYVLNREMDGVQTLYDDIESNGGEVLGK